MSDARWERLAELFHASLEQPAAARERFLADSCGGDAALRAEVERLLQAHERAGEFIERPALAAADSPAEPEIVGRRVGAYRVTREIARGGMGAVYLAERADGQFEHRVAIKLIKRGMDTDLVLRRFRAERRILASLDHPNIARLLDGGTTEDGRPYFVMEYIEGEPIDAWADARRLTIPDRLALLLQVCGAVSYAHHALVVHRDIKPDNILVTAQGTPKLLDFGIAKVLEPGTDEPTSTVTGFRLLTPEYASPEQVEGRHATEASDVYSLGVVLYELLTGRSPYRLTSRDPLEVAEAVRTGEPERPSTAVTRAPRDADIAARRQVERDRVLATSAGSAERLRRQLRGDLDTIAMMALRKEPARRYATVDALATDLQRHLNGLPVRARRDGLAYRTGKFLRRKREVVAAAALAGIATLLLGAGLVAMRAMGRRADAADARGVLAPRDRIVVAELADRAGDSTLASALSEAFRVEIAQSPFVQILTERQVRASLERLERPSTTPLDDSLAREVALREGAKAFVTGEVVRVAGRYTINAQLSSAESGVPLATAGETATDSTDLIPALDRLAAALRRRMGESLRSIRATPPLMQVTTPSLAALRAYTDGERAVTRGDREAGIRSLERAVALDTGFASAYRLLGVNYADMVEVGRATAAIEHAIANQARLPFYERYHTVATYDYNLREDYPAAIDAYRHILERYPDDVRALNNLGYVYSLTRNFPAQEALLQQALAVDSTIPVLYTGVVIARTNAGDFAGARRMLDSTEARFPKLHHAELGEIYLAAAQRDWATAERKARARLTRSSALDSLDGLETLAGIVMTQGRLAEAEGYSRQVMSMAATQGSMGRYLSSAVRLSVVALRYRQDTTRAIADLEHALARARLDSIEEGDRPYDDLARFFAGAGRPARARELIAQSERTHLGQLHGVDPDRRWTLGVVALAEGRHHEAMAQLREAAATVPCTICALPDLARAYESAHEPDSAIAVYEHYLAAPWEWRFETDAAELGWAMQRLAMLYAQRGDAGKSAAAYARLAQLWSRADRELEPVVREARRRSTASARAAHDDRVPASTPRFGLSSDPPR